MTFCICARTGSCQSSRCSRVDQTSPYYHDEQKGSVFYAESWALTHYIEISDAQKNTNRLQTYAELLMKKEDPIAAAQQAFGDLTQFRTP